MIMLHGRGQSPEELFSVGWLWGGSNLAYLAPTAAGRSWYLYSLLATQKQNKLNLSFAIARVQATTQLAVAIVGCLTPSAPPRSRLLESLSELF
jgi:hypothetical protein